MSGNENTDGQTWQTEPWHIILLPNQAPRCLLRSVGTCSLPAPTSIMGRGKGLKSALQSQQSRLKEKEKVIHAARVAEGKRPRMKLKGKPSNSQAGAPKVISSTYVGGKMLTKPLSKTTIPFKPTDRILLVGEGNFSFTRALVDDPPGDLAALHPGNITATAYDTEEVCHEKYPESQLIVSSLRESGVEIIFGVDATLLERHARLKGRRWDRIVWNFPHAGALHYLCEAGLNYY